MPELLVEKTDLGAKKQTNQKSLSAVVFVPLPIVSISLEDFFQEMALPL